MTADTSEVLGENRLRNWAGVRNLPDVGFPRVDAAWAYCAAAPASSSAPPLLLGVLGVLLLALSLRRRL